MTDGGLDYKFRSNVARYRGLATNEEGRFQTVAVSFANGEGAYWTESTGTHTLNEREDRHPPSEYRRGVLLPLPGKPRCLGIPCDR